jgi:Phage integrase family
MEELADHLRIPGRPTDQVFKAQGGGPLRISNFRRNIWRPAVAHANLVGLRIHDLRHTAVALWIAAGASPKEVAARAGHTSTSFVLNRYGVLFPEAGTALRTRLDSLFRAATEHRRNTVPRTRTPNGRSHDLRRSVVCGRLPGNALAETIRC